MKKYNESTISIDYKINSTISVEAIIRWVNTNDDSSYPLLAPLRNDNQFWMQACEQFHDITVYDSQYAKQLFLAEHQYDQGDSVNAAKQGSYLAFYDQCNIIINNKKYSQIISYCDDMPKFHGIVGCLLCLNVLKEAVKESGHENMSLFCELGMSLLSSIKNLYLTKKTENITYITHLGWLETFQQQCLPLDKFIYKMNDLFQDKLDRLPPTLGSGR